jgi:hypothetical protein
LSRVAAARVGHPVSATEAARILEAELIALIAHWQHLGQWMLALDEQEARLPPPVRRVLTPVIPTTHRWHDDAAPVAMRRFPKHHVVTADSRARMSAAKKAWWARKKAQQELTQRDAHT